MNPLHSIYTRVILPALDKKTYAGVASAMERYEAMEGNSLVKNQESQWRAVLGLLQHAYETVPFYRRRFDEAGVDPQQIQSPSDLVKIPPLTKDDIRGNLEELRSRDFARTGMQMAATGGTTDTPVPLMRDERCARERMAVRLRFNAWAKLFPGDKVFWMWGARTDFPANPSWRWRIFEQYVMRRHWAPTSLLNKEILDRYAEELNRFRPKAIIAYPTPLAYFAEHLLDSGSKHYRPDVVICTAEPYRPEQREVIDRTFGVKSFNHYGSRDFGMVGAECEAHLGLHLNPGAVFVEFQPLPGDSGMGEMLVTDLLNLGMPMIRYRVNDCGTPATAACACGRGYPLVKALEGRTTDVFTLENGDMVPGVAFTNRLIKVCPGIVKMQLVQETTTDFCIRYVPSATLAEGDLIQVREKFKEFIGQGVKLRFERVAEIEREASGKTRFAISHVRRQPVRNHDPVRG